MMIENTPQNFCEYTEELVSYLYDEISATEKIRFEAHLPQCSACAAELTDFSTVRSSIIEWRETEFQQLTTPAIQLPVQKGTFRPIISKSGSLLAQIRALFSLSPAWASAATAAALVICIGLLLVAVNFQRERDVTRVEKEANTEEVVSTPKEETAELKAADFINNKKSVSEESSKPPIIETKEIKPKKEDIPIKISQPAAVKTKKDNTKKPVKPNNPVMKKMNQSPPPTLLADEDEIEDDSLRLSDIFKEVGTR